jgi:hypothetical protein
VSTTPLTKLLYPPWYQLKVEKYRRGEIDWDGNPTSSGSSLRNEIPEKISASQVRRLLVYLRLDSLPSLFTFITLLGYETSPESIRSQEAAAALDRPNEVHIKKRPLEVHGLRIIELTERTSSVMQVTEGEEYYSTHDPVVNAFRTFSQLHDVAVSGRVSVVPASSYAETLMSQASDVASDFALIPWSEFGSLTEDQSVPLTVGGAGERFKSGIHLDFVQNTLQRAVNTCTTGIFINNGFGGLAKPAESSMPKLKRTMSIVSVRSHHESPALPVIDKTHHIFFPFFGGLDDRVALRFVLQLAKNPNVTATITYFNWQASRADHTTVAEQDAALLATLQSSLPQELVGRVVFEEVSAAAATLAVEVVSKAQTVVGQNPKNAGDIVVLGRQHDQLEDSIAGEGSSSTADFRKTVGVVADRMLVNEIKASLLVIQAGGKARDM